MAVPAQTPSKEYIANGTTTAFPLEFNCDKAEYLIVTLNGEDAPVGSWTLANDTVTFNVAPVNGVVVNLERNTPFQRTTNYQLYDNSFRPSAVNKDFDLIWWKLQELGYRDQVIWLALVKEIADRIAGDENLQNQINTIDEWLGNLQENVDQNTNDIVQLVNDLSKEIADRIKGDQILKDMFLSMIDEAINEGTINALAVTHVDSLEGLEGVTNVWDGRTIYVKDLGNYRYDAFSTSWVKSYQDADNVKYEVKTQKQFNDELKSLFNPLILRFTAAEIAANFTNALNTLIAEVANTGGGTIEVQDRTCYINVVEGIELKDNIELRFGKNTILKAIQTATNSYQMFRIHDRTNVKISGGRIDGNRSQQLSSTGAVYKDWKPNTAYAVGDCIALQRLGAQVTVAGTTGSTPPTIVKESNGVVKVGVNYTDGSCQYTSIQDIGEWGMGISIRGGKDIDISDISIDNCWGDAIYVGRTDSKSYAENVRLRNIRMLNNRRQGISLVSAEKFRASSIYIANTNGTDPQSGIDLEPNLPDERLLDVVIDGLYTEGCSGHGLHVWVSPFDNLTAEENKVNVFVNNFTDIGSTRALYCSTSRKAFAKGRIEINGMRSINPKNGAIYHEACNADGVQFYLNDPYIETRDVGAKAPVRSGIAVDTNMVCGGIHIRRPRIKQLGDKYETPIIISNSNGNLKGFKNISIIDPVEIDANSSTNQGNYLLCSQNIDNFNISDSYNASRKDLNGYTYEIFHNYMQYFLSANDTAWRSITLGGIKKGRKFTVVNENLNGNGITVNFGTNITVVDWSPVGALTLISLDKRGSRIEFEAIDENVVRVLRATSDIVNNSKIMTYDYDFPDLAAGASAFVDIPWARATTVSFVEVSINIDLQGCQLRAQCLTSGTVRVRVTNATNASVNLPGGTLRLRIV